MGLSVNQLVEVLGAAASGLSDAQLAAPIAKISTDTRSLAAGDVFVALRGDRFDGHRFVAAAIQQGAIAAVVDAVEGCAGLPLLKVADTLEAYQAIARWWRLQFQGPVVAVTGSVGKTTTKELIAAVVSTHGRVLKTEANYNNEIGVPKTLLELSSDHDFAVIEMGMRAAGEIALLAQIARPDIAVITNVGTAHIGRLGSEQAIANAKCELLAELPSGGVAVLNADSDRLIAAAKRVWRGQTLTYGLENGDLRGQMLDAQTLALDGHTFPLPLPGRHNAVNYLAALAVAKLLHLDWSPLTAGLTVSLPQGRSRRLALPNDLVILDETYNAGLESMVAALHLLAETPGRRHIAVLGTMKELGDRSPEFHRQVGVVAQQLQLDHLLIWADPAESEAMAAGAAPLRAERFENATDIVTRLTALIQPGDRLLFKASRAVGLDRVVEQICDRYAAKVEDA